MTDTLLAVSCIFADSDIAHELRAREGKKLGKAFLKNSELVQGVRLFRNDSLRKLADVVNTERVAKGLAPLSREHFVRRQYRGRIQSKHTTTLVGGRGIIALVSTDHLKRLNRETMESQQRKQTK